jgi:hypothetical protein
MARAKLVIKFVSNRHVMRRNRAQTLRRHVARQAGQLVVIGDELWERRGGVGAELRRAADPTATPMRVRIDTDLAEFMEDRMYAAFDSSVKLGDVRVRGHRADALVTTDDVPVPVVLDPGVPLDQDPTGHLRRMLRRRELFSEPAGPAAVRLPAWILYDHEGSIAGSIHSSEDISILGSSST